MKNKENKPTTFKLWEVIVITLVSSLIMSLSTGYVVSRNKTVKSLGNSKALNEFISSYKNIVDNYYDEIDETALVDAAINGMLKYLGDPYTTYLNESNTNILNDSLSGTYEGIGVTVSLNENSEIVIREVFEDTPAYRAGLQKDDIITKINDNDLTGKSSTDAVTIIKEAKNSPIKIEVKRNEEIKTFNVEKSSLYIPAIYKEIYNQNDKKIGYLQVSKFSDTIYEQFNKNLKSLEESKIDSLIIDLRNNTGGYLSEATSIAELFIEKNKIIYSLENKMNKEDTKDSTEEHRNYKIYVLINNGSASASEVLAAALKYSYGATLIGSKSYGKGKVQRTSTLNDGTMYKYTSAKWLTPKGDCIDEIGLNPDIPIEISESYIDNPSFENDNQLQTAIYELAK